MNARVVNKATAGKIPQPRGVKGKIIAFMVPVLLVPGLAVAGTGYDQARVLDAQPVYERVSYEVPVEACREETVAYSPKPRRASATAPILGAIIGGALGNAVGHKKRNKQVGTVVGAVLGGSIGADVSRRNRGHDEGVRYRTEQVCDTAYERREEERLAGYRVRYEYAGQTYTTRMQNDPGEFVRVRVNVSAVSG